MKNLVWRFINGYLFGCKDAYNLSPLVADDNKIFKLVDQVDKRFGAQMIKEISITIGGQLIQKYSDFIKCMVDRDYNKEQKELFNEMTGNIIKCSPESYIMTHILINLHIQILYRNAGGDYITPTLLLMEGYYIPLNFWVRIVKCTFPNIT